MLESATERIYNTLQCNQIQKINEFSQGFYIEGFLNKAGLS